MMGIHLWFDVQLSEPSRHIPNGIYHTRISTHGIHSLATASDASSSAPHSAPLSRPPSWHSRRSSRSSRRFSHLQYHDRPDSRLSEPAVLWEDEEEYMANDENTVQRPSSSLSAPRSPIHAIATPQPTLLFALASDNVDAVRKVLEEGETGPNDSVGPQSALAFTVTAQQLTHKLDMVKLLLAHGADPSTLRDVKPPISQSQLREGEETSPSSSSKKDILDTVDPATR